LDPLGFGLALLAMVLFGLYMVPRKVCGLRDFDFVLSMSVGAVVTTQAVQFAVHHGSLPPASVTGAWLAFSCGPIWALGILFYTLSVSQMGLALATPIKNTTAVLGTLIGLLVFSEWRQTSPLPAMVGSVLVVGCAVVLGRCGEQSEKRSCVTPLGVVYALLAAVFFAAYTIPLRFAQKASVDSYELLALMGLGTLFGSTALFVLFTRDRRRWFREPMRHHLWAALAGAVWASATLAMAHAIERVGLAVTWPVTNLNTIVTVAAGIVIFHEIDLKKRGRDIALSMALAIVGSLLLGLSRR